MRPTSVVAYVHGGSFVRGNWHASRNVSDYFASLGTADTQLSAEILQLMQSTSSSGQPMSAN